MLYIDINWIQFRLFLRSRVTVNQTITSHTINWLDASSGKRKMRFKCSEPAPNNRASDSQNVPWGRRSQTYWNWNAPIPRAGRIGVSLGYTLLNEWRKLEKPSIKTLIPHFPRSQSPSRSQCQPTYIPHTICTTEISQARASLPRRNYPNLLNLPLKFVWCGWENNQSISEVLRKSVHISNIIISAFCQGNAKRSI